MLDTFRNFRPATFSKEGVENKKPDPFYALMNHRNFILWKIKRLSIAKPLRWLRTLVKMAITRGQLYIRLQLTRIKIAKTMFLLDVETGNEVLISSELCQDSIPKTFRYYDFMLHYIHDNMDLRKMHFYGLKKSM